MPEPTELDNILNQMGGFVSAEVAEPIDQLKLAIIGAPKSGKSRLAATGRKPLLIYDFDGRAASVAGIKDVYVKSVQDNNPMFPTAISSVITDIGQLEYLKSQGKELPFKTIVVDSIRYMSQAAMYQAMRDLGAGTVLTIGGQKIPLPKGKGSDSYKFYDAEYGLVINTLVRLFYLGVDVIAVFHERPEEAEESTQAAPKFTGNLSVDPPRAEKYLPLFNEQWHISPENGKYTVRTKPGYAGHYNFIGATCLDIDEQEEPNIESMIVKHTSRKGGVR